MEPVEALLRLVDEEDTAVSYVGHGMSPDNVARVLQHPLVMIGSDGSTMAPTGRAAEARPHPRSYGTCPRVLGYYAREQHLFDLPTAVRKMTSLPADQIGLQDRGRLARGRKADMVVFDAATVIDLATFEDPHHYPAGIVHVLVNGVPVVERGRPHRRAAGSGACGSARREHPEKAANDQSTMRDPPAGRHAKKALGRSICAR